MDRSITTPRPGSYRCAECRDGEHLSAWAGCNAYGPVGDDGELSRLDDVVEWGGVYEDSIQCDSHPDAVIECFEGGMWRRWWRCGHCAGTGNTNHAGPSYGYGREYYYPCPHGRGERGNIHQGWLDPAPDYQPPVIDDSDAR